MTIHVREMAPDEAGLVVDYFHGASADYLNLLGVDRALLVTAEDWRISIQRDMALPLDQRDRFYLSWFKGPDLIGFSSCDQISFGNHARMHLHITAPDLRARGLGAGCVRQSIVHYLDRLKLKQLFCEPNAFNIAPNRTLQKAGFKYLKTYETTPGPFNFHQSVTRWVYEP